MGLSNKHGLTRDIPSPIRRAIRQRDGFGCVVCGAGFYEYDHFNPEFSEATEHVADGIILLCEACHAKKTRKRLSKATIAAAAENPKCKQNGFAHEALDVGTTHPEIILGNISGRNAEILLRVYGDEILSILPPESEGAPFRLNARMADKEGKVVFEIVENEWRTPTDNWDVEWSGPKVVIRKKLGDIVLSIKTLPPDRVIIERLNMFWRGTKIIGNQDQDLEIISPSGAKITSGGISFENCKVGIDITPNGIACGLGGSMLIKSMTISSPPPLPVWFNRVYFPPSQALLDYLKSNQLLNNAASGIIDPMPYNRSKIHEISSKPVHNAPPPYASGFRQQANFWAEIGKAAHSPLKIT